MKMEKFASPEMYIKSFPANVQKILRAMRSAIKKAAPKAQEGMSYGMPGFKLHGYLVCYAAFKNHVGFFPAASGVSSFKSELKPYKTSKGTIQFPLGEPLPLPLITKITKFRAKENSLQYEKRNA